MKTIELLFSFYLLMHRYFVKRRLLKVAASFFKEYINADVYRVKLIIEAIKVVTRARAESYIICATRYTRAHIHTRAYICAWIQRHVSQSA